MNENHPFQMRMGLLFASPEKPPDTDGVEENP